MLSLAIQGAALTSPFLHAHPDDHATQHHGSRAVHTHWAGHGHSHGPSERPQLQTEDQDRAVYLNPFVAVTASVVLGPAIIHDAFALPVPSEGVVHRNVGVLHSHDPPFLASLASRAPPALLS